MIRATFIALALALVVATPAAAEPVEVTAQAKAAKAEFLRTATPPGPAATICLVDTGVNVTPDTPGVVARMAVTGDTLDQSPTRHGTQMAMLVGAPANGYGTIGLWPHARILSVRANEAGKDTFTAVNFIKGVQRCSEAAVAYGVKVVLMPYSSAMTLTADESEVLQSEVQGARQSGISFVAAAGNNNGGPVGSPANVPGVLSIGATNGQSGDRCGFSATGALLFAPGCAIDGADPVTGAAVATQQGTSHAAAVAAAALAALRTWRPDLTPDDADRLLNESGRTTPWGRNLDVSAAFVAAGLSAVVGPAATPPPPAPPSPAPDVKQRLPRPKIAVRSRGRGATRTLTVKASNRPKGARMTVRVYIRGKGGKLRQVASRSRASATVRIRVRSWRRVTARFSDPTGAKLVSRPRIVTPR